ncbi:Trypsin-like cysteine/serine peptidase domain containing protein [Rhypophila decipiens]
MIFTTPILAVLALVARVSAAPSPDALLARAPPVQIKTLSATQIAPFLNKANAPFSPNSSLSARDSEEASHRLTSRTIVGADNRVLWPSPDYPYSAVGKLTFSSGPACTGTMIGRRHVATAKQCLPSLSSPWSAHFAPSYYDGERLGGSNAIAVFIPNSLTPVGVCGYKEDWAIIILADPIGDTVTGWFGSKQINCTAQKNIANWFHMGWPADKGGNRPYRQEAITVTRCDECAPGGPLETDADVLAGQTGGPLWLWENGSRYLYGMASYGAVGRNYFASGPNFYGAIGAAYSAYP